MKTNLKVKTSIKAGDPGFRWNHNATQVQSLKVKSGIKAGDTKSCGCDVNTCCECNIGRGRPPGGFINNHSATQLKSLKSTSGIKAVL